MLDLQQLLLLHLLYSVTALSSNHLHNQPPTALPPGEVLKRFDPCCLQGPPPPPLFPPPLFLPPLFPPPEQVWRTGQLLKVFEDDIEAERGRGCDEEDVMQQCLAGPPGPPGPAGAPGSDGIPGVLGPKGDKGDMGRPGPKGRSGRPGLPGRPGSAGWPRLEGPKGEKGDQGAMGEPGIRGGGGVEGLPGYKGEKGSHGEPGGPGPNGDQGESGHAGMLGQKGETGPKGEAGVKGKRGPTGRPGKRGKQGSKGQTGRIGPMGPAGSPGPTGQPGALGHPASVLYVGGEKGDIGLPGPPGQCDCGSFDGNGPGSASLQRREKHTKISALLPLHALERKKRAAGLCGDGEVQPLRLEECDNGNRVVTDGCVGCKNAYCGDGFLHHSVEECDGKDFGYQTCRTYLPGTFGQLTCTDSCSINTTGCRNLT